MPPFSQKRKKDYPLRGCGRVEEEVDKMEDSNFGDFDCNYDERKKRGLERVKKDADRKKGKESLGEYQHCWHITAHDYNSNSAEQATAASKVNVDKHKNCDQEISTTRWREEDCGSVTTVIKEIVNKRTLLVDHKGKSNIKDVHDGCISTHGQNERDILFSNAAHTDKTKMNVDTQNDIKDMHDGSISIHGQNDGDYLFNNVAHDNYRGVILRRKIRHIDNDDNDNNYNNEDDEDNDNDDDVASNDLDDDKVEFVGKSQDDSLPEKNNVDRQTLGDLDDQETKAVGAKSSIQDSNKRNSPVLHQHQPSTTNDAMKSNKSNTHDVISQNSRRTTYTPIEKLAILTEIKLGAKTQNEIILSKGVSKSMVCRWKKKEEALKALAEFG